MIKKLINRLRLSRCYVIADANDNSVTFSRWLCRELGIFKLKEEAKVYMCRVTGSDGAEAYAFILNPQITEPTQLADVMYNSKYKCVGFESLCPTVNRIFYDYKIPAGIRAKLSVKKRKTGSGVIFYELLRPEYGKQQH